MSHSLISRSPDLKALHDDGFELAVVDDHLVVHHVPHVNTACRVRYGTLFTPLTLAGDITTTPGTHVVQFDGDYPCHRDGRPIEGLRHGSGRVQVTPHLAAQHSFSNKPKQGFRDYEELVRSYVNIISGPAASLDPAATAQTYRVVPQTADESVFCYLDTATARAGLGMASAVLAQNNVAIVGLGGTGSYVLDLLAKTPIVNLHLYDGDDLLSHNAFRSPGAATVEELRARVKKVAYYAGRYAPMRRNLIEHPVYIDASNIDELTRMDFVFICVDRGDARKLIVDALLESKVPFIDVGMGVELVGQQLLATLRVTTNTAARPPGFDPRSVMNCAQATSDDVYAANIQVADLNSLNATLAVLRWKKFVGFYMDHEREHQTTYSTSMHLLTGDHSP